MNISKEKYSEMTKKASPNSNLLKDCLIAFLIGGLLCLIGQILTTLYMNLGLDEKSARSVTSISLVFVGAFLTCIKVYDNIAKFAGAGTLVPITGFANSIVAPAIEFKTEGFVLGMGVKMFTIAGPVLVFGISASVLYGIIYFFVKNIFNL